MLEILAIVGLCKFIGAKAAEKGLTAIVFQILIVLFWIGGEVVGFIVGLFIFGMDDGLNLPAIAVAYGFALLSAGIIVALVFLLPAKTIQH